MFWIVIVILGETFQKFTFSENNWGYGDLISIAKLYEERETLLRNNTLQLSLQMTIYGEHYTELTALPLNLKKSVNSLQILSADLLQTFNNEAHSDVEFVCGSKTFYAHKVIMSGKFTLNN